MKRVVGALVAALMVVGLTSAFAPAALAADAVPAPGVQSASEATPGPDAVPSAEAAPNPNPDAVPSAEATPGPDAIPGTDAATSRSITGHIDLGSAGHPATVDDVTINVIGWSDEGSGYWLHYTFETHPGASGDFTIALGQLEYVVLEYDYIGPGNFVSAYSSDFHERNPADEPGVIHLTKSVTAVSAVLAPGGTIGGSVVDPLNRSSNGLSAYAYPAGGLENTPQHVTAAVNADGSYQLKGLPAGTYSVSVSGYDPSRSGAFSQMIGGTAAHPEGVSKTLAAGGRATFPADTMKLKGTINGYVDCGGDCLVANRSVVSLQAYDPSAKTWVTGTQAWLTVTGSDPVAYSFGSVLPGTYRLVVKYQGYADFDDLVTDPFELQPGEYRGGTLHLVRHAIPSAGVPASVSSFITALYVDFLNRRPSAADVAFWGAQLANGAPRSAVAAGFVNSDEYRLIRIDAAYHTVLNRAPDAVGRQSWLTAMKGGTITTDDIERTFYASFEFYLQHGNTDTTWAAALYAALLGRPGLASDHAFWGGLAIQHGRPWVVSQFWDSTETISTRVTAMYVKYFGRQPDRGGLATWVGVALALGDSGLRSALTSSDEYFATASTRFPS